MEEETKVSTILSEGELEDGEIVLNADELVQFIKTSNSLTNSPSIKKQPLANEGDKSCNFNYLDDTATGQQNENKTSATTDRKIRKNKRIRRHRVKDDSQHFLDEYEMLCVRGHSPVDSLQIRESIPNSDDSSSSDASKDFINYKMEIARKRKRSSKQPKEIKKRDKEEMCTYHMLNNCPDDDCQRAHDGRGPRKPQVCKFYVLESCAKGEQCLYMHSDFPCKFYYLGMKCRSNGDCKFLHGKPLTESMQEALLKHLYSAPKTILGDFQRLSSGAAARRLKRTHAKLSEKFGVESTIPLSPDGNSKNVNSEDCAQAGKLTTEFTKASNQNNQPNDLSLTNFSGMLTQEQINRLMDRGIRNLSEVIQSTLAVLTDVGLSISQISLIQWILKNIPNDTKPKNNMAELEETAVPSTFSLFENIPTRQVLNTDVKPSPFIGISQNSDDDDDDEHKLYIVLDEEDERKPDIAGKEKNNTVEKDKTIMNLTLPTVRAESVKLVENLDNQIRDPRMRSFINKSNEVKPSFDHEYAIQKTNRSVVESSPTAQFSVENMRLKSTKVLEDINKRPIELISFLPSSSVYRELGSNEKIAVNQHLYIVAGEMVKIRSMPADKRKLFNSFSLSAYPILKQVITSLGIYINDDGMIQHIPEAQDQRIQQQNTLRYPAPPLAPFNVGRGQGLLGDVPNEMHLWNNGCNPGHFNGNQRAFNGPNFMDHPYYFRRHHN